MKPSTCNSIDLTTMLLIIAVVVIIVIVYYYYSTPAKNENYLVGVNVDPNTYAAKRLAAYGNPFTSI